MKIKRNRAGNKYTFTPEDEKDEKFLDRIAQLEEENRKLRAYADNLDSENDNQAIEIEELKKENKKLREEVRFLEECLDNKEKVNKSLREGNKKLREGIEMLSGNIILG